MSPTAEQNSSNLAMLIPAVYAANVTDRFMSDGLLPRREVTAKVDDFFSSKELHAVQRYVSIKLQPFFSVVIHFNSLFGQPLTCAHTVAVHYLSNSMLINL